ncbi:hypothetical protein KY363_03345 [Candidatus Woesearchaeota archaeon]|nr:hypothetical protein [Candidatus Woesearchaeota archaeon]
MAHSPETEANLQEVQAMFMELRPKALKKEIKHEEKQIKGLIGDVAELVKVEGHEPLIRKDAHARQMISDIMSLVIKRRMITSARLVINTYRAMVSKLAVNCVFDKDLADYMQTSLGEMMESMDILKDALLKHQNLLIREEVGMHLQMMTSLLDDTIRQAHAYSMKIKQKDWNAKESLEQAKREFKGSIENINAALAIFMDEYVQKQLTGLIRDAEKGMSEVRL